MNNLAYYIGTFDACVVGVTGLIGAGVVLSGADSQKYWERILPACGVLVGTSIAAGILMAGTRWLTGA